MEEARSLTEPRSSLCELPLVYKGRGQAQQCCQAFNRNRPPPRATFLGRAPCDVPLKRVFKLDIEVCPKCGGKLRVIAAIAQPGVIQKNLDHVHQQQAPPRQSPSRVYGPITTEIQFDVS